MIETVTEKNINDVLPLINEYQRFYGMANVDDKKNKQFFSQFIKNHENGILYLYRVDQKAIGFTTIYKGFSSTRAEEVAVLNDLYIQLAYRGHGYGKELINHALIVAKDRGFSRLQWLTAEGNEVAQKLYDELDINKSTWFFYTKDV